MQIPKIVQWQFKLEPNRVQHVGISGLGGSGNVFVITFHGNSSEWVQTQYYVLYSKFFVASGFPTYQRLIQG